MAISEYEREVLESIEQQLREDAPELEEDLTQSKFQFEARRVALGAVVVFCGFLILLFPLIFQLIPLCIIGFVVMIFGTLYILGWRWPSKTDSDAASET